VVQIGENCCKVDTNRKQGKRIRKLLFVSAGIKASHQSGLRYGEGYLSMFAAQRDRISHLTQ
jgi:hypothetical protein